MKLVKKTIAAVVVIIAIMSVFAIPASAASSDADWQARIAGFSAISIADTNTKPGYTGALQVYLVHYGGSCASYIGQMAGVDGWFGNGTESAVITYQTAKGLHNSNKYPNVELGAVGTDTWNVIGGTLTACNPSGNNINLVYNLSTFLPVYQSKDTSPYTFKYVKIIDGMQNPSSVFHTCY